MGDIMRHNRRKTVSEINLTPLLDVLFSILFIVMMTGMQNEQGIKKEYQEQVSQLELENEQLSKELARRENQMSSYDKFQSEAVILTVNNILRGDNHYLLVYKGTDKEEIGCIQMGINKTENTKARIESLIMELINDTDNQPVYIVFYCDKKQIYTAEYRAVVEAYYQLQENNKAVFFKIMEENK